MASEKPQIIVSHPTGNANVRNAIAAFSDHNMLFNFQTTVALNRDAMWLKLLPESLRTELLRRSYDINQKKIITYPYREIGRQISLKFGIQKLAAHETGMFSVDAVYRNLDKKVARSIHKNRNKIDAVYAYEDGALETFKMAEKAGIFSIYDLPKGYWRAEREFLASESNNRPDWAVTLAGFKDSDHKLLRKDEELLAAQHIIVASSFTKHTLTYFEKNLAPVSVIPYGFPEVIPERSYNHHPNQKLKLLFVGSLSQLKGLANVIEAVEEFQNHVELTIVGRKSTNECLPLNEALKKHKYIPSLPHKEIMVEMKKNDVLLFPSLFEGFGLVVTEAMSQGTPVITTNRTCGGDIIKHNHNGWIVEAGSTESLINQIKMILDAPKEIERVGKAAMETAKLRPWNRYQSELMHLVEALLLKQIEESKI